MKSKLSNGLETCVLLLTPSGKSFVLSQQNFPEIKTKELEKKNKILLRTSSLKEAITAFYKVREKLMKKDSFELISHKNSKLPEFKKSRSFLKSKKPTSKENHVGIEIEFLSPISRRQLAQLLCNEGLDKFICLKDDVSIEDMYEGSISQSGRLVIPERQKLNGYSGHELCLVAPQSQVGKILFKLQVFFKKAHAKVNSSCGVHVHLDMRNRNVNHSFSNLVESQSWLYKLNKGRKDNKFCKEVEVSDFQEALKKYRPRGWNQNHRFRGINVHSYKKLKTLEIRIHKASLDMKSILQWTKLLIKIADGKKSGTVRTFSGLVSRFSLNKSLQNYILRI